MSNKPRMTSRGGATAGSLGTTTTSPPIAPLALTAEGWRLEPQWFPLLPKTKCLLYGDSGTGKSTFAATYAEVSSELGMPILVCAFDPPSKMSPYKDHPLVYDVQPVSDPEFVDYYTKIGMEAEDACDKDGNVIFRLEYYIDPDPDNPIAADLFEVRMMGFYGQAASWYAVVFDSMTFYQYACIRRAQKRLGFTIDKMFAKGEGVDMRQWSGIAKLDINRALRSQMLWWKTNAIAVHHASEEKAEFADTVVRGISTVGKLAHELPPGFDEMYKMCLNQREKIRDEHGKETADYKRYLQTRHDTVWAATSVTAKAPNPCEPNYRALWKNWVEMKEAKGVKP